MEEVVLELEMELVVEVVLATAPLVVNEYTSAFVSSSLAVVGFGVWRI